MMELSLPRVYKYAPNTLHIIIIITLPMLFLVAPVRTVAIVTKIGGRRIPYSDVIVIARFQYARIKINAHHHDYSVSVIVHRYTLHNVNF